MVVVSMYSLTTGGSKANQQQASSVALLALLLGCLYSSRVRLLLSTGSTPVQPSTPNALACTGAAVIQWRTFCATLNFIPKRLLLLALKLSQVNNSTIAQLLCISQP